MVRGLNRQIKYEGISTEDVVLKDPYVITENSNNKQPEINTGKFVGTFE